MRSSRMGLAPRLRVAATKFYPLCSSPWTTNLPVPQAGSLVGQWHTAAWTEEAAPLFILPSRNKGFVFSSGYVPLRLPVIRDAIH